LRELTDSTLHTALIWIGAVIGVSLAGLLVLVGCYPDRAQQLFR
jgi:hypothetical protein